jgi:hypothetical protein
MWSRDMSANVFGDLDSQSTNAAGPSMNQNFVVLF